MNRHYFLIALFLVGLVPVELIYIHFCPFLPRAIPFESFDLVRSGKLRGLEPHPYLDERPS